MRCIFTVDVEDWFHILDVPSAPGVQEWGRLPSRVERDFFKILELFGECSVQATCFFLGWIAQRFPHLVREAARQGHEIASHGYAHRLVYEMTPQGFYRDAILSKEVIEDALGQEIEGYRSSGFSVTERTKWFFEMLVKAGYRYDSSVFPTRRGHGGFRNSPYGPHSVETPSGALVEVPITVAEVIGKPLCFFGGGYLRLFPLPLIRTMAYRVLQSGRPVVFYVHPREFDPDHPRLPMGVSRKFKTYVNLATTEPKVRSLLGEFEFTTLGSFISQHLGQTEKAPGVERVCGLSPC